MKNIITFDQMTIDLNKVFPETKLNKKYISIGLTSQLRIYKWVWEKVLVLILYALDVKIIAKKTYIAKL